MNVLGFSATGSIEIESDGLRMSVPDDPANRHRQIIAEWEAAGNAIPPYMAAPVAPDQVDAERERRTEAGFEFAGHAFQSLPADRENIAGAATAALGAMMMGAQPGDLRWHGGDSDFVWIAADNALVPMDAQTTFAFGQAAMAHKSRLIFQARALKDADPIPADYVDDQHWPPPA